MSVRRYSHVMHLESTVVGDLEEGRTALDALLGPATRLLALGHVSNALGTLNPVAEIAAEEIAARERAQLESQKQKGELEPLTSDLIQINYAKAADIANILGCVTARI